MRASNVSTAMVLIEKRRDALRMLSALSDCEIRGIVVRIAQIGGYSAPHIELYESEVEPFLPLVREAIEARLADADRRLRAIGVDDPEG